MHTPYSHIIKAMRDQTGKSLNSLLYEWNKAKREIEIDELANPNAYSKLTDELLAKPSGDASRRDLSPLIADRFKKNVMGDDTDIDSTDMESEQADEFEQVISSGIDDEQSNGDINQNDPVDSFDEMFGSDDDTFNTIFGSDPSPDIESPETETDPSSEFDDLFSDSQATDNESDDNDEFDIESLFSDD